MVSKHNSEGYKDPVVHEALTRVEAEERAARAFSRFAVEKKYIPIAPHLLCPQYMDEETERWLTLKMGIVFMGKCEEVWGFGDVVSEGMALEIEKAKKQHSAAGGICPKWVSPGFDGMPDRIVLLPDGRMGFVEVKAPGEKPRPLQASRHGLLRSLGYPVYVLDEPEQIEGIIDEIRTA